MSRQSEHREKPVEEKTDQHVIQQVWYTWSDIGLDAMRSGARMRAASQGLRDERDTHVKALGNYRHYALPLEANSATAPAIAPVCLAFIIHEEDRKEYRILVHKEYTGKDDFGRNGVFFTHLLDNLPPEFSAADAILLWKSGFWQNSDAALKAKDPFGTTLDTIPYETWRRDIEAIKKKKQDEKQPVGNGLDTEQVRRLEEHLSYLIQIYLSKKPCIDPASGKQVPAKIYIAAPDSYVALLISGLTHCLPEPLLKELTFSTYERDVREATTEIVGACWLSVPGAQQMSQARTLLPYNDYERVPEVRGLLPSSYYAEKLALNCYTGQYTPLENSPLVEHRPLAMEYAQEATEHFLHGNAEFQEFLDGLKEFPPETVDELLMSYKTETREPTQKEIEFILFSSNYRLVASKLKKKRIQQKIIELALTIPGWWNKFARERLIKLRKRSAEKPELAKSLVLLASDALPYVTDALKEEAARLKAPPSKGIAPNFPEHFRIMKEMMQCTAPPTQESGVWIALLKDLRFVPDASVFFNTYWDYYAELIKIASALVHVPLSRTGYSLVEPLLTPLSWQRFGDFLSLQLPLDWNERVTASLVSKIDTILDRDTVSSLEQRYHPLLATLLTHLSQEHTFFTEQELIYRLPPDAHPWHTASRLFRILATSRYGQKVALLSLLLDSAMARVPENAEMLLMFAQLTTTQEIVSFLKANGPRYLPSTDKMAKTVFNLFGELAKREDAEARTGKMEVLRSWLEAPQLTNWLEQPTVGEEHLAKILKAARLSLKESEWFFLYYGKKYVAYYPSSLTLLDLFDKYSRAPGKRRREFLSYWLDLRSLPQNTLDRVLQAALLDKEEHIRFIEQSGELYLPYYPESQVLLSYVLEYLEYVQTASLDIFLKTPSPERESSTEGFLGFLLRWPQLRSSSRPMINDYYQIVQLIRMPALLNSTIAESVGRLLNARGIADDKRDTIIKRLTIACLEHAKTSLTSDIATLSATLKPKDMQTLLDNIAVTARNCLREQRAATLVALIRFALTFQLPYLQEAAQEAVTLRFLRILLEGRDDKAFIKWLNKEANKWSVQEVNQWKRYRARIFSSVQEERGEQGEVTEPMPPDLATPAVGQTPEGSPSSPEKPEEVVSSTGGIWSAISSHIPRNFPRRPKAPPAVDQPPAGSPQGTPPANRQPQGTPPVDRPQGGTAANGQRQSLPPAGRQQSASPVNGRRQDKPQTNGRSQGAPPVNGPRESASPVPALPSGSPPVNGPRQDARPLQWEMPSPANQRQRRSPTGDGLRPIHPIIVIAILLLVIVIFAVIFYLVTYPSVFSSILGQPSIQILPTGEPISSTQEPVRTPAQEPYASSIQGTPVLTLQTTKAHHASIWDNTSPGPCTLTGSGYVAVASTKAQPLQLCLEHTQPFRDNFAYQVKVSVDVNGSAGGLVFFYSSGNQPYYRFALFNGGLYSVVLSDPHTGGETALTGPSPLPVRWQPGQAYLLTVIVQNQNLYFYIGSTDANSQLVYQTTASSSINASTNDDFLGIYATTLNGNQQTTVTVSSLKVWNLVAGQKSQLPGS